jgi:16S rRNA C967 or C1407 C5-methylase (RsmB/RsmF family)
MKHPEDPIKICGECRIDELSERVSEECGGVPEWLLKRWEEERKRDELARLKEAKKREPEAIRRRLERNAKRREARAKKKEEIRLTRIERMKELDRIVNEIFRGMF